MHPLPRVGEITEDVDDLPRMAIISLVTGTANEVFKIDLE